MIRLDPTPCLLYLWPETPCPGVDSGAHACRHAAGHAGLCCCAQCGAAGERDAWAVLIAAVMSESAELARLRARVAAYDSVRDVLEERRDVIVEYGPGFDSTELDRLNAALAATETP